MVNACFTGEKLLQIIAEECFHLYPDVSHAPGWRRRTDGQTVEDEATNFVRDQAAEIRSFLDAYSWSDKLLNDPPNSVPRLQVISAAMSNGVFSVFGS